MALLTDDQDKNNNQLRTGLGNNGDYYIEIVSDKFPNQYVRIATSGGNAPTDVKIAVANLYRAMENAGLND